MTTNEIFHLWANQSKTSGKSGNVFFEGAIIYSYGHHFPIAKLAAIGEKAYAFLSPNKYSVTTTRHQSLAERAIHGREVLVLCPKLWDRITDAASLADALAIQAAANIENRERIAEAKRADAARARARKKAEAAALAEFPKALEEWREGLRYSLPSAEQKPTYLRLLADKDRIETS